MAHGLAVTVDGGNIGGNGLGIDGGAVGIDFTSFEQTAVVLATARVALRVALLATGRKNGMVRGRSCCLIRLLWQA